MFFFVQTFLLTFILKPFVGAKVGPPARRGPVCVAISFGVGSEMERVVTSDSSPFRLEIIQHRTTPGQRCAVHKSIAVSCYSDLLISIHMMYDPTFISVENPVAWLVSKDNSFTTRLGFTFSSDRATY